MTKSHNASGYLLKLSPDVVFHTSWCLASVPSDKAFSSQLGYIRLALGQSANLYLLSMEGNSMKSRKILKLIF